MTAGAGFSVILLAGGSGQRLRQERPKQYQLLQGRMLLCHVLDRFLAVPEIDEIVLVVNPAHEALYRPALAGLDRVRIAQSGKSRSNSVFSALNAISDKKDKHVVLIHDAARPFVSTQMIRAVAHQARETGAASLAIPVSSTLRHAEGHMVSREGLYEMQTPQGFRLGIIRQAHHAQGSAQAFTDDSSMVAALGHKVHLVAGSRDNFKITYAEDMALAERLLQAETRQITRTGHGFDVHGFDPDRTGSLMLCGVPVPHDYALKGHSDADVALHALTDALLGAMAEGDIGQHFPPSDPQWRDQASDLFLRHAVDLLRGRGGALHHLDVTLICEQPKITPYRMAMRQKIAEICGLSVSCVSVKATTTEGLGFTGRGEGIAAMATATITLPQSLQKEA